MASSEPQPVRRFSTDTERLEAFSDGVLAVIITIMVLELHSPTGATLASLRQELPRIALYALSFVFIGIYWNNHHHMLRASKGINGAAMWANLHLLFWLSLVPFATEWLGRYPRAVGPTVVYSALLLMNALAWWVLERTLLRVNGKATPFAEAIGIDIKGRVSVALYALAIAAAFFSTIVSDGIIVAVAILWFIPDRRFEPLIAQPDHDPQ
jgi:uncharacterized membrane protein